jgi:hypothetical protein
MTRAVTMSRFIKGLFVSSRVVGQFVGADAESIGGRNGIRIGDGYDAAHALYHRHRTHARTHAHTHARTPARTQALGC